MGFYDDWALPRILNLMMGMKPIAAERKACLAEVKGSVLEVGFGADDAKVRAWQDRLNGLQMWMCGGCNLNRPMAELITGAGFEIETLDKHYAKGPKPMAYFYRGIARRRS